MPASEHHHVVRRGEDVEVGVVDLAVGVEVGGAAVGHRRVVAEHGVVLEREEREVVVIDEPVAVDVRGVSLDGDLDGDRLDLAAGVPEEDFVVARIGGGGVGDGEVGRRAIGGGGERAAGTGDGAARVLSRFHWKETLG
jgi:hypothetical protein